LSQEIDITRNQLKQLWAGDIVELRVIITNDKKDIPSSIQLSGAIFKLLEQLQVDLSCPRRKALISEGWMVDGRREAAPGTVQIRIPCLQESKAEEQLASIQQAEAALRTQIENGLQLDHENLLCYSVEVIKQVQPYRSGAHQYQNLITSPSLQGRPSVSTSQLLQRRPKKYNEPFDTTSNQHIRSYEWMDLTRLVYQFASFVDHQYGQGRGEWRDTLFNGCSWPGLRLVGNKYALMSLIIVCIFEKVMWGTFIPWTMTLIFGVLFFTLRLFDYLARNGAL